MLLTFRQPVEDLQFMNTYKINTIFRKKMTQSPVVFAKTK